MKYKEIYQALERRWQSVPGFRFTDRSGWRSSGKRTLLRRHPLWIVMDDLSSNRRIWLTQEDNRLEIVYWNIGADRNCIGSAYRIACSDQRHMVQELEMLFTQSVQAA